MTAKAHQFGAFVGALAAGGGDIAESRDWAKAHGYPEIGAAMRSDRHDAGGAWVPENLLEGVIELLRPRSAIRSLNPVKVGLDNGNASIRKRTGGSTAYYKGEAQQGTVSEGTSGMVNLVGKQLMVMVPITHSLLRAGATEIIEDDALGAIAAREDLALIRGPGTVFAPKGLRYQAVPANVIAANGTVNLANVTTDLGKLVLALENADVRMLRPGWAFAPRTKRYLMDVRDGNGNFAFRDEMLRGTLNGHPFATTSQIPINLGSGSDSEVYIADFADVVLGEVSNLRVNIFDQATYWDGSQWVSCAQNDEVVLRLIAEHDLGMRHDESVAVLTGATWGS